MNTHKIYTAIGLMSGTSLDGIDAALIQTNGLDMVEFGASITLPYTDAFAARLKNCLGQEHPNTEVERDLTLLHVAIVESLLAKAGLSSQDIDLIGFHGHTVHHDPAAGLTVQLGDGALLAKRLNISVVSDMRSQDVAAGGEGAPLVPVFHAALVRAHGKLSSPVAVVNIGGVANVTWVGADLLAFDTGPGNAPLNDWVHQHTGETMDKNGEMAAAGRVDAEVLSRLMDHAYFDRSPPKSLDRQDFQASACSGLSLQDGAATLTAFIAKSISKAQSAFPHPATTWVITGGGRHNPTLMKSLQSELGPNVISADSLGWDGDALEAQAFAYLSVRSHKNLPLTFPMTTGVEKPLSGGTLHSI